jgi:hypothetical protein
MLFGPVRAKQTLWRVNIGYVGWIIADESYNMNLVDEPNSVYFVRQHLTG